MTQHIGRLTPLADMLGAIASTGPAQSRDIATAEALGCVLASDVIAKGEIPNTDTALRDGWAVNSEATRDAGPYSPMPMDPPPQRIDAFAPLPAGTDAVAPSDAVTIVGRHLQITAPVPPGEGVVPRSGDAAKNGLLLKAGTRLRASDIAVLMLARIEKLSTRVPRIRIVNTKPGLLEPVVQFVANAAKAAGAKVIIEPDGNLEDAFRDTNSDAIIGIGGTGSGRKDRSVIALSRAGKLHCHGVALAPGDTSAFGHVDGRPVLLLPGRFDAAVASWLVLGVSLITRLTGEFPREIVRPAKLTRKIASPVGIAEFVPLRVDDEGATPLGSTFLSLQHLAAADAWMLVPAESEGYPAGTTIALRALL